MTTDNSKKFALTIDDLPESNPLPIGIFKVGRLPTPMNDVQLSGDSVAAHHLQIHTTETAVSVNSLAIRSKATLEDTQLSVGTWHPWAVGQTIRIGPHRLVLHVATDGSRQMEEGSHGQEQRPKTAILPTQSLVPATTQQILADQSEIQTDAPDIQIVPRMQIGRRSTYEITIRNTVSNTATSYQLQARPLTNEITCELVPEWLVIAYRDRRTAILKVEATSEISEGRRSHLIGLTVTPLGGTIEQRTIEFLQRPIRFLQAPARTFWHAKQIQLGILIVVFIGFLFILGLGTMASVNAARNSLTAEQANELISNRTVAAMQFKVDVEGARTNVAQTAVSLAATFGPTQAAFDIFQKTKTAFDVAVAGVPVTLTSLAQNAAAEQQQLRESLAAQQQADAQATVVAATSIAQKAGELAAVNLQATSVAAAPAATLYANATAQAQAALNQQAAQAAVAQGAIAQTAQAVAETAQIVATQQAETATAQQPRSLRFVQQPRSLVEVNQNLGTVTIRLRPQQGGVSTTTTAVIEITLIADTGTGKLNGQTTVVTVNGVAIFTDLHISAVGTYRLRARAVDLDITSATSDPIEVK